MARPTIAITAIFAEQTNYDAFNGTPPILVGTPTKIARGAAQIAEGWNALEVPPAQEYNWLFYGYSTWLKWVGEGSFTADQTDHIVETDSNGKAALAELEIGGVPSVEPALVVNQNTLPGSAKAGIFVGTDKTALEATNSGAGSDAALVGYCTGGAPGVLGLSDGGGPAGSFLGLGADSNGLNATPDGTGHGGVFTDSGASGDSRAIQATCSNDNSTVIDAENSATATNVGQVILCTSHGDSKGLHALAYDTSTGVYSRAINNNDAIQGLAQGVGAAVSAENTTNARPPLYLAPKATAPGAHVHGDLMVRSDTQTLDVSLDSVMQKVHSSVEGICKGQASVADSSHNSAIFTSLVNRVLTSGYAPRATGTVIITVSMSVRNSGGSLNNLSLRVRDATAGVTISTHEYWLNLTNATVTTRSAAAYEESICLRVPYVVPATGVRDFEVQIATDNGGAGTGVDYSNVLLEVSGVFI